MSDNSNNPSAPERAGALVIRGFALLVCGMLVFLAGWHLYQTSMPVPRFRTPERVRESARLLRISYLMIYGGPLLGLVVWWLQMRRTNRPSGTRSALVAAFGGLLVAVILGSTALGFWRSNIGPAIAIYLLLIGLLPTIAAALLVFALQGPRRRGAAAGSR